jgi:uncharacterized membrane protein
MLDTPMREVPRDIVFMRHEGPRGFDWLRQSYALFRRARLPWLLLILCYYVVLVAIKLVPFVGGLAAIIMKPVFAVGFLAAAWNQERGVQPSPRHLFQGFRSNLWALIPLGVVLFLGISLAFIATSVIDGGRLVQIFLDPAPADLDQEAAAKRLAETLAEPRVQIGMLFGALCALPTILALWWAPALVVFQDVGVPTALRTSLRAALANWRPLLRYGISVFFFAAVVPSLLSLLIALVAPQSLYPLLAAVILLPYTAFFVATLQISDYVSYRDVFHAGETLAPLTPGK